MRELDSALNKLHNYVLEKNLFPVGAKLLLTCSGGADSVALLHLFARLRPLMQITLLAVHVDHQLRGADSDADAELVKRHCLQLNIPLIVRKIHLEGRHDLENRARQKRLEVCRQIIQMYRFDFIVTAHHKNDQAETVLLNLIRGAGINGLAGIRPQSEGIIHPLLDFDKAELTSLLKAEEITWREDSSNQDQKLRRNWIRHTLLPLIQTEVNPQVVEKLSLQAEIFLQAEQLLWENSARHLKKLTLEQETERTVLSLPELLKLSRVEQYYILKRLILSLGGSGRDFFHHSFDGIMQLAGSKGSSHRRLKSDLTVRKQYQRLIFVNGTGTESKPEPLLVEQDRSRAVYGDFRFHFRQLRVLPLHRDNDRFKVYLDAGRISYPITIRGRREGDRFIPLGMEQPKKLKDFFIDEKVSKFERDRVPLLDDGEKIIWVVGHRIDDRVKITPESEHFLQIVAEPVHEKPKRAANRIKGQGETNEQHEL